MLVGAERAVEPEEGDGMKKLDPHKDVADRVEDVKRLVEESICAPGLYVIKVGKPRPCKGCGRTQELRFGYCWDCVTAAEKRR